MLNFLLQALALRFLIFDYYLSPVQRYLQTATNPILVSLAGCPFCQGCEAGFIVQLFYCDFTPKGIAIAFLNGISAGFVAMEFNNWVTSQSSSDFNDESFDNTDSGFTVVEDEDEALLEDNANTIRYLDFLSDEEKEDLLTELYDTPPEGARKTLIVNYAVDTEGNKIPVAHVVNVPN